MIKKINTFIITFALIAVMLPQFTLAEQTDILRLLSIRIDPSDESATIIWSTNYPTKGIFEFGLTNGFGNWLQDNNVDQYHETSFSGLLPDQKYYFRLTATTLDEQTVTTDVYNFETVEANDNTAPQVTGVHTSFITGNTATFVWQTNELADSCVYYGDSIINLNHTKCSGSKVTIHDITATGLTKNHFYYYKISSKDSAGNIQYSVYYNFVTAPDDDTNAPNLQIYEISPFNSFYANDSASMTLTINANRPIEGDIRYGTKSGSYNKKVYLDKPRSLEQEKTLTGLEYNKKYYYKVYLKDVLNKTLTSPEYSFQTLPQNLLTAQGNLTLPTGSLFNINNPEQDFDGDGLTNLQEQQHNTDPLKADTDGDGYIDGVEVLHGYNPSGPGRIAGYQQPNFSYGLPRLASLAAEQNLAQELQNGLENLFNGPIPISQNNWPTLVNAYVYGGYPIQAIYQSIVWSGKTVHPTLPWTIWQNSADYINYINK